MPEPIQENSFSNALRFPKLLPEDNLPRVYIEWRGLKLANPLELEDVGEHKTVAITRKWVEGNGTFLKMVHPSANSSCDFEVLRVRSGDEGNIAVLKLADGWPERQQAESLILVRVMDEEHVRTLDLGEFLRALQSINLTPYEQKNFDRFFGSILGINSAEYRAIEQASKTLKKENPELFCFYCEAQIVPEDNSCTKCGKSLVAPKCPLCGELVSNAKDRRVFYDAENGHYPWHYTWDERCQNCHHHFSSALTVSSGHHLFFSHLNPDELLKAAKPGQDPFEGKVEIKITAGESVRTAFDDWDYRPTIHIEITRHVDGNNDSSQGALLKQASISLTEEEFEAIKNELEGPLSVLLERKKWSRDTT